MQARDVLRSPLPLRQNRPGGRTAHWRNVYFIKIHTSVITAAITATVWSPGTC
ncbi:hypothetical protein J6590_077280 [Homalodisca vitripennis]|nr:hypothetical protein J6590_077280 [Homalodisca vitripennis]